MTAPKVGDRVRVEVEGVVSSVTAYSLNVDVPGDKVRRISTDLFDKHGTVLAPPVNVGDVATLDILNSLPHGSVVIAEGGLVAQLSVDAAGDRYWRVPGRAIATAPTNLSYWPATVLHIGGSK